MSSKKDDQVITELFNQINTPTYDILEGVKTQMRQKTTIRPRAMAGTVIAVLVLILTTGAVFAAYQGMGGFTRLRGIVGEERAGEITPVEVDDIVEIPYLPGGFRNPNDDRFAIELVATYGQVGGIMEFYFTLEDLTGARANCELVALNFTLHTSDCNVPYVSGQASEVIHSEGGITTIRGRTDGLIRRTGNGMFDIESVWCSPAFVAGYVPEFVLRDGVIKFSVQNAVFNTAYAYVDHSHVLDLGLVRELSDDEIMTLTKDSFDPGFPFGQYNTAELLNTTGLAMPHIGLHNYDVNLPRVSMQISAIGMIGNSLYILTYEPFAHYSRFSALWLQEPSGNKRLASRTLLFSVCPDGLLYFSRYRRDSAVELYGSGYFAGNAYQLYVFDGISLDRLEHFTLAGKFDGSDDIWLNWVGSFMYRP